MHLVDPFGLIVYRSVGKLQELIAQGCGACYADLLPFLREIQDHLPLHIPVGFLRFRVQHYGDLMVSDIRKLQVILRFHGNADV